MYFQINHNNMIEIFQIKKVKDYSSTLTAFTRRNHPYSDFFFGHEKSKHNVVTNTQ